MSYPNPTQEGKEYYCDDSSRSRDGQSQSNSPSTPVSSNFGGPAISEFGLDDNSGRSSVASQTVDGASDPAEVESDEALNFFQMPTRTCFGGVEDTLNDVSSLHSKKKLPDTAMTAIFSFADEKKKSSEQESTKRHRSFSVEDTLIWNLHNVDLQTTANPLKRLRPGVRTFSEDAEFQGRSYSPPKRFKMDDITSTQGDSFNVNVNLQNDVSRSRNSSADKPVAPDPRRAIPAPIPESKEESRTAALHLFGFHHHTWDVWGSNSEEMGWNQKIGNEEFQCLDPLRTF